MSARNNGADFQRDVAARSTSKNYYVAAPNSDGTVKVTKNGVTLHPRVFYAGTGGALTDANPTGDRVIIIDPNGIIGFADATVYLNTLA
ncbi:MAG TPA: hypothetical protein VK728_09945 [Candidatus Sulfotelmatobacter sp.]|jgi:hypothetical protein|nr:hypothetical protein [Candidatus Sulfotelmatobacter sp.]